jgi:hypothetical protein
MMQFVEEYLSGARERLDFDLDFNHYLITYYSEMEAENIDLAECFYFYLAEEGFDQAKDLSNTEHKRLIREQYNEFKAVMRDGFC